ncbi:MAG: ArnT family glycosyltransferase [Elusimicrobiota bacterium]
MKSNRLLGVAFLLALSSPFWRLGMPLIEVDDARYGEVPREMVIYKDWATPRLDGMDYVEKPPLWYWMAAASYKIFGVNEAAARLPLALLSLLGLLLTAWLGTWLFSREVGMTAAVFLASSALYFFLSHYMTLDMALSVFLLGASAMILRALLRPDDSGWAVPLAWIFAALAFLSKGLIAVVFPAGWVFLLAAIYPDIRKNLPRLFRPMSLLLFFAITAPWFVVMEKIHPGFFHFFFVDQHIKRFLTLKYQRDQPWFFFLLVLPAAFLPITPAILNAPPQAWISWKTLPKHAALWLWILIITLFFSISHSKLATYILPVFPHLCVLSAAAVTLLPIGAWPRRAAAVLGALFIFAAAAGLAACRLIPSVAMMEAWVSPLAIILSFAAILALAAAFLAFAFGASAAASLGLTGLVAWGLLLGAMGSASTALSIKAVGSEISREYRPGDKIDVYDTYFHGLPFYAGHRVNKIFNWTGELAYAKKNPSNAGRFGTIEEIASKFPPGDCRQDKNPNGAAANRVFLVFKRARTPFVQGLVKPGPCASYHDFGPWELAQFSTH